jgi:tRNA pseudouridine32 synthase/23S rRNA pseudouridine746 synthase
LERKAHFTRVAFYPLTGRTHQLRVHAAHPDGLNCPIVGDPLYGRSAERMYLHAESLSFIHPVTLQKVIIETPVSF